MTKSNQPVTLDEEQKKAARRAMFRASQKKRRNNLREEGKEPITLIVKQETTAFLKQIQSKHGFITTGAALDFMIDNYLSNK
jgi:hypothetical protein